MNENTKISDHEKTEKDHEKITNDQRIDIINIFFGISTEINEKITMDFCNYFDNLIQYGNFEEIYYHSSRETCDYGETQITIFKNEVCYFSMNIQRLQHFLDNNVIRAMVPSFTGTKNSYGIRKSISIFNLNKTKQNINDLRLSKNTQIKLVSDLRNIMKEAEKMRKNKTSPTVIEEYKLKKFQEIADRLNQTKRLTI